MMFVVAKISRDTESIDTFLTPQYSRVECIKMIEEKINRKLSNTEIEQGIAYEQDFNWQIVSITFEG